MVSKASFPAIVSSSSQIYHDFAFVHSISLFHTFNIPSTLRWMVTSIFFYNYWFCYCS